MSTRLAIVTGGNRGIGLEIVRQLAELGLRVILCSRDEKKGKDAAAPLQGQGLNVTPFQLDVSNGDDILRLREHVVSKFRHADVLVNNAGVMLDKGWPAVDDNMDEASALRTEFDALQLTMDVNAFGAYRTCQAFVPLMLEADYGRVVNVSSAMGQLSTMGAGWAAYRISKAAMNAVTRVFAAEVVGTNVAVNSASPGWVRTEMGSSAAPLSVEQGADTIVWLATHPEGGPSGKFFREREPMDW